MSDPSPAGKTPASMGDRLKSLGGTSAVGVSAGALAILIEKIGPKYGLTLDNDSAIMVAVFLMPIVHTIALILNSIAEVILVKLDRLKTQ